MRLEKIMETDEKYPEFGRYLRTYRRSKGISLEEVSQRTKINLAMLRHLENDNLEALPAPAFVKGFIRAYGQVVGVDVQEAIKRYENLLAMQSKHSEAEIVPPVTAAYPWRRYVFLGLGLVLLLGAIFYLTAYFNRSASTPPQGGETSTRNGATAAPADDLKSDQSLEVPPAQEQPEQDAAPAAASAESPQDESVQEEPVPLDVQDDAKEMSSTSPSSPDSTVTPPAPEAASSQAPETEVSDAVDALVLEVEAVELTWFKVQIDNDTVREVTIEANDRVVFTAREQFDLIIGNAGGVELQLNGRPIPVPGKSGQVVTMRLP